MKDEDEKEIGRIISFLIDSSGHVEEVLVENKSGKFVKYPVDRLRVGQNDVSLVSPIDVKMEVLSEELPVVVKKRRVLDKLSENKVIPQEIYESLCKEFDKALKEMKSEAQNLLDDAEKQIKVHEDYIRTLQLSRTFLEIEHEIGTVKDEEYQQSRMSILKEIKNAQQKKLSLLKVKERVSSALQGEEEEHKEEPQAKSVAEPKTEPRTESRPAPAEEKEAIPVRVTQ